MSGAASPPIAAGTNPFNPKVVFGMVVFGFAVFVALLWMIGAGMTDRSANNGEAHAGSKGLTGYAALAVASSELDKFLKAQAIKQSGASNQVYDSGAGNAQFCYGICIFMCIRHTGKNFKILVFFRISPDNIANINDPVMSCTHKGIYTKLPCLI